MMAIFVARSGHVRKYVALHDILLFPSYNLFYALNLALSRSDGGRVVLLAAKL
jgi:hypothetical protein